MPSVDPRVAYRVLAQTKTFRGKSFKITLIYGKDNEEKCFRVETQTDDWLTKSGFRPQQVGDLWRRNMARYPSFHSTELNGFLIYMK